MSRAAAFLALLGVALLLYAFFGIQLRGKMEAGGAAVQLRDTNATWPEPMSPEQLTLASLAISRAMEDAWLSASRHVAAYGVLLLSAAFICSRQVRHKRSFALAFVATGTLLVLVESVVLTSHTQYYLSARFLTRLVFVRSTETTTLSQAHQAFAISHTAALAREPWYACKLPVVITAAALFVSAGLLVIRGFRDCERISPPADTLPP